MPLSKEANRARMARKYAEESGARRHQVAAETAPEVVSGETQVARRTGKPPIKRSPAGRQVVEPEVTMSQAIARMTQAQRNAILAKLTTKRERGE